MTEEQKKQQAENVKKTCEAYGIDEFKYRAILAKVRDQMLRRGEYGQVILNARFKDALDAHYQEEARKPKDDVGSSLFEMMAAIGSAQVQTLRSEV